MFNHVPSVGLSECMAPCDEPCLKGQDLFVEKADCQQFIDLLRETADLFNVNVAAYYLMPTHLIRCLAYIDLNMVRAGIIRHPGEWMYGGYNEIQNPKQRYWLTNRQKLSVIKNL